MVSYGSLSSPSLHKMNGQMETGRRRRSDGRGAGIGNIIGDPFALATISIAILAWLIAFISSVIAALHSRNDRDNLFPNYVWWTNVYMFFCICGVIAAVVANAIHTYHVAIVGFMSAGVVLTSSAVQALVYSSDPRREAAAAGHILLSMITIVWIFYFGSTPDAGSRAYVDSFALHKDHRQSRSSRPMADAYGNKRPATSVSSHQQPQMYTSAQLNGFETSSPVSGFPGGPIGGGDTRHSPGPRFGGGAPISTPPVSSQPQQHQHPMGVGGGMGARGGEPNEVIPPTEYPYRAKAIYSYEANPEDANEISFSKHEILEVSDVSGRWWQAKKETGETGIAPSNYLILL